MADRKPFLAVSPVNQELLHLLEESKKRPVTEEELREQRISFAFGNALNAELITKESVRQTSKHIRLCP